jgi:hypothetical protein
VKWRLAGSAVVLVASMFASRPARADPNAQGRDPAAAEALFDEARRLLADKRYPEACAKLEMSQRLDPGTGTLLNLGNCLEKMGRLATAWARFREAAAAAVASGQHGREQEARARAAALEPRLSRLVVRVAAADKQPSLVLKRDDVVIDRELWGTPLPVDPGRHTIVASATNFKSATVVVTIEEGAQGSTRTVDIPALQPNPPETATAPPSPAPRPTPAGPPRPKPAPDSNSLDAQRAIALAVGGSGVVALGIGTVLAWRAKDMADDASARCVPTCPADAAAQSRDAGNLADGATVLFVAGGVLVASSIVLFLTAPSRPSPAIAFRPASLRLTF